jgi:hypothetical protein
MPRKRSPSPYSPGPVRKNHADDSDRFGSARALRRLDAARAVCVSLFLRAVTRARIISRDHGEKIATLEVSEVTVKRLDLSFPEFGFVVATRAALGAGIGLLLADKLGRCNRRRVGATLLALGVLTTIPAVFMLFGRGRAAERKRTTAAA